MSHLSKNTRRLQLETLEDRLAPAVSLTNGYLYITQSAGNDTASVRNGAPGQIIVTDNGVARSFSTAAVTGRIIGKKMRRLIACVDAIHLAA